MAPTSRIFLTRHAQAEHNVEDDYSIPDAPLTPLGKRQAARLPSLSDELQNTVDVILSSPLRRTLQTVSLGYPKAVKRLGGLSKVVCVPQLQGSDRQVLEQDPEFAEFDLSSLTPDWTSKQGFYAADETTLNARAKWIRQYLRERPEANIVVMAHGDILRRIIQEPYPWTNAEVREFQFVPEKVQTDECPLYAVQDIAAGGRTDAALESSDQNTNSYPANSAPKLPVLSDQGAPLDPKSDVAQSGMLASIEERVKQIQASVDTQAGELEDLDRRLAEAEAKKSAMEN
ncbi:hypothetical protein MYAM1_000265 [Malassezia yamatoensis]|uniref:Phosphoglycerate mutase-like protein n=1 Tax=Malassezia yamatoensis TaxID=253288 RepID=A0AAJ5YRM8_9BASI|nr:hypothetical protein MYAM1_000265 [Malassezia yamatoensis]